AGRIGGTSSAPPHRDLLVRASSANAGPTHRRTRGSRSPPRLCRNCRSPAPSSAPRTPARPVLGVIPPFLAGHVGCLPRLRRCSEQNRRKAVTQSQGATAERPCPPSRQRVSRRSTCG